MTDSVSHVFVYGTLKRGHVRAHLWPRRPLSVAIARVRGALYDLGPYPALVPGDDWVEGELWEVAPDDILETLSVLDQVEGYEQLGHDLYRREIVRCHRDDGQVLFAYAYLYCGQLAGVRRVGPESPDDASSREQMPVRWTKNEK